jgi:mRNA interferase YafQ
MRRIERTAQFKRDYKREKRSQHRAGLDESLLQFVGRLVTDARLPERARDHALSGEWKDFVIDLLQAGR